MTEPIRVLGRVLMLASCLAFGSTGEATAEPTHPEARRAETPSSKLRKVAIVVGANAAIEGRRALAFAHEDARAMARVLTDVGRFSRDDLRVLFDPEPTVLEQALERALAEAQAEKDPTLLLFYYSGHADGGALYPGGQRLDLSRLREKLEDRRALVRVGILDACEGGQWTAAKGLTASAPFTVPVPLALESEGSVLLASSSGRESAHEVEALRASLFTHHILGGLRGAADANEDKSISVGELFAYARALTTRDAALLSPAPQHPSFHVNLKGRQDLVLAELEPTGKESLVEIAQQDGPLEIIHLGLGTRLAELPSGPRRISLALPPGRYLIQRRVKSGAWARELDLAAGAKVQVTEAELELRGLSTLVAKGSEPIPVSSLTTLPRQTALLRLAFGVEHWPSRSGGLRLSGADAGMVDDGSPETWRALTLTSALAVGLTDRLQLVLPGLFTYRLGQAGGLEWNAIAGLSGLGLGYSSVEGAVFSYDLTAGTDARLGFGARRSVSASVLGSIGGGFRSRGIDTRPNSARTTLRLYYSETWAGLVTVNVGAGLSTVPLLDGAWVGGGERDPRVLLGATGVRGGIPLPLVQVHLSDTFAIDGFATISIDRRGSVSESYLLGFSATF